MSLKSRREARRKARANEAEPSTVESPVKLLNARDAAKEVRVYLHKGAHPNAVVHGRTTPTGVVVTVALMALAAVNVCEDVGYLATKFGFKVEWV